MNSTKVEINQITETIIGAAIEVHKAIGPGLLESAYEACLDFEIHQRGLNVKTQVPLPVIYKDVRLDCGYRLDLLVEYRVLVELKAVETLNDVHKAQLLSYLKLSGLQVGLLINFNEKILKNGLVRLVNNLSESPRTPRSLRFS